MTSDPNSRRPAWRGWATLLASVLLLAGCASLPTDYPRTQSHAFQDTGSTRLARQVAPRVAAHPGLTGAYLMPRGIDAFLARLALADAAEKSLDLQYYIWHADLTGRVLTMAVLRAADRGVRVRLLLDDVGTAPDDLTLLMLDAHPNIEVRLFNPIAARAALESFAKSQRATPYAEALRTSRLAAEIRDGSLAFSWGGARLVYDDPDKIVTAETDRSTHLEPQLGSEAESARKELLLMSPYFVPGEQGVAWMRGLRKQGIRVRVVTNSLAATDVTPGAFGLRALPPRVARSWCRDLRGQAHGDARRAPERTP